LWKLASLLLCGIRRELQNLFFVKRMNKVGFAAAYYKPIG